MPSSYENSTLPAWDEAYSRAAPRGSLIIAGPHDAAELIVVDGLMRVVARGIGSLEAAGLPPGLYDVRATLGGATASQVTLVSAGSAVEIAQEDWGEVTFPSAAPLKGTSTARESQAGPARTWCSRTTWQPPQRPEGTISRLFIFVRTLAPEKNGNRFSRGLVLLDADGRLLTELAGSAVEMDRDAGWMAFCADVPPGPYLLGRKGYRHAVRPRFQPIYLCPQWDMQVFIPAGYQPSLRRLSLMYVPRGERFDPEDDCHEAAELLSKGLGQGRNLVPSILPLLETELQNGLKRPWLALVAAHSLYLPVAAPQPPRSGGEDEPATTGISASARAALTGGGTVFPAGADAQLYQRLVQSLRRDFGDHPDVRALELPLEAQRGGRPAPFVFPPLLQASLSLVRHYDGKPATERASDDLLDLIPEGSLTDCLLDALYSNSLWSGWGQLSRLAAPLENLAIRGRGRNLMAAGGRGPRMIGAVPVLETVSDAVESDPTASDDAPAAEPPGSTLADVLGALALNRAYLRRLPRSTVSAADTVELDGLLCLSAGLMVAEMRKAISEGGDPGRAARAATERFSDPVGWVADQIASFSSRDLSAASGIPYDRLNLLLEAANRWRRPELTAWLGSPTDAMPAAEYVLLEAVMQCLLNRDRPDGEQDISTFSVLLDLEEALSRVETALRRLPVVLSEVRWLPEIYSRCYMHSQYLADALPAFAVQHTEPDLVVMGTPSFAARWAGHYPLEDIRLREGRRLSFLWSNVYTTPIPATSGSYSVMLHADTPYDYTIRNLERFSDRRDLLVSLLMSLTGVLTSLELVPGDVEKDSERSVALIRDIRDGLNNAMDIMSSLRERLY
jgi:hypothetical protein